MSEIGRIRIKGDANRPHFDFPFNKKIARMTKRIVLEDLSENHPAVEVLREAVNQCNKVPVTVDADDGLGPVDGFAYVESYIATPKLDDRGYIDPLNYRPIRVLSTAPRRVDVALLFRRN